MTSEMRAKKNIWKLIKNSIRDKVPIWFWSITSFTAFPKPNKKNNIAIGLSIFNGLKYVNNFIINPINPKKSMGFIPEEPILL